MVLSTMQLSQTVSMLLASILLVLSVADATPILNRSTPSKFITLPIKRYQYERKDLHPLIVSSILDCSVQILIYSLFKYTGI
jgi:hypothetical protein